MYLNLPKSKPRSRKAMIAYLQEHARYDTMNSWNRSTSYAHCIKVDRLGLAPKNVMACLEMLDVAEAFEEFSQALSDFDREHDHRWQIGQNGRSGGYLVLIQGGKGDDGRVFTQPGRSLDMGEDFTAWEMEELRARVSLVWDFDQACDQAVTSFIEFAESHTAEEREILVPRKIKVAVRTGTDD